MSSREREVHEAREAREAWQRLMWLADRGVTPGCHSFAPLQQLRPMVVDAAAEAILGQAVEALWDRGWQPAEVVRHLRQRTDRRGSRLADLVVVADRDGRRGVRVDPRWQAQVDDLQMRDVSTRQGWLKQWRDREGIDHLRCYRALLAVWAVLFRMPTLQVLVPPPGADPSVVGPWATSGAADVDPVLERIRKLLAKAEATTFEAEATAFTAKAQDLMSRHAIDRARLEQGAPAGGPVMVRLYVDPPYVVPKQVLLGEVARANRCRAIAYDDVDMSTVIGHRDDQTSVEMLFTSLLVQAGRALAAAATEAAAGSRSRSATFRHTFLLAYARRIGERLRHADEAVLAETGARDLVPVLRARSQEVDDLIDDVFGDSLGSMDTGQRYDAAGAAQGRAAADRARLHAGELSA